jgi:hypothetical protein
VAAGKPKVSWNDRKLSGKANVDLRFYSREEYNKLSDEQKLKLKRMREESGRNTPRSKKIMARASRESDGPPGSTQMNPDHARRIAALEKANTQHPRKSSQGNRNHPSLKRAKSSDSEGTKE